MIRMCKMWQSAQCHHFQLGHDCMPEKCHDHCDTAPLQVDEKGRLGRSAREATWINSVVYRNQKIRD